MKKICTTILIAFIGALFCGCASTSTDFDGIAMGEYHFRDSNMGDTVAQVMAAEKGTFIEEITPDSPRGKEIFGEGADGSVLEYNDSNVSGHSAEILYVFLEDELVASLMSLNALYPKDLYSQLSEYYENELSAPTKIKTSADSRNIENAKYWEKDDVCFEIVLTTDNTLLIQVATPKYFKQLFD